MNEKKTDKELSKNFILNIYKESVKNLPILKYSWVLIATICILALAGYFKLKNEDVFLCLRYGRKSYRAGACFYTILDRDIRKWNLPQRLSGLCVLVGDKNVLITVYKNKKAISNTKKLSKFNLKKSA